MSTSPRVRIDAGTLRVGSVIRWFDGSSVHFIPLKGTYGVRKPQRWQGYSDATCCTVSTPRNPTCAVKTGGTVSLAPKTGPQAKVYNGVVHPACGGAARWSRNGGDTRRPTSFGLRWKRLKAARRLASCRVNSRVHPNMILAWNRQLLEDGPSVFARNGERKQREREAQEAELYEQIGRLKKELEWLKKSVAGFGQGEAANGR